MATIEGHQVDPSVLIPTKTEQNQHSLLWKVLELVKQGKLMQATPLLNRWQPDENIEVHNDETALLNAIDLLSKLPPVRVKRERKPSPRKGRAS